MLIDDADNESRNAKPPQPGVPTTKDAGKPKPPRPSELAESFPQLEIIELLGQGGMGYVYKARQKGLDRLVALKLLPLEISGEERFSERFAREARALAKLNHPAIVTVHDSGRKGDLYYFIMEYVDGLNLRDLLRRSEDGRVEEAEALRIVGAVCDALEYAHEEGVVHRDIKPENILLDRKGRVKIADFGLAKLLGGDGDSDTGVFLTLPQQRMGTPHYMAPEQTERPLEVDHRADIYSVGVVFYEMLTGELPLGRFPLPSETGHGDATLDRIVVRALEKSPQRRFQRASEIKTAVDSALSGEVLETPATPRPVSLTPALAMPALPTPVASASSASRIEQVDSAVSNIQSSLDNTVDVRKAYERVRTPGWWLLVTGIVSLVLLSPTGVVLILAGIKMRQLEWRVFCIVGACVAILPLTTCFPLSLPFGIWALWVLTRLEIAAAFDIVAAAKAQVRYGKK